MTTSVWPYETYLEPIVPFRTEGTEEVTCFVAQPSKPESQWNGHFEMIKEVFTSVSQKYGLIPKTIRAIDIASSGIIHPEIWDALRKSDIVICDVTGHNGNVILELGVASAWRRKESVIILRDKGDEKDRLFDIMPARHLEYERTYPGLVKLRNDLASTLVDILATYPFTEHNIPLVKLPFSADFSEGKDARELYTESIAYRKMNRDCIEFGSPLIYRHSWMSLGNLKVANVYVQVTMKQTLVRPNGDSFMGVMVRGSSYYANLGHLVAIRQKEGVHRVFVTERIDDSGNHEDNYIDELPDYSMRQPAKFDVSIFGPVLTVAVNDRTPKPVELRYPFTDGMIIFIAGWCRVCIQKVKVEEIPTA